MDICIAELATWGVGPDVNKHQSILYNFNCPSVTDVGGSSGTGYWHVGLPDSM